MNTFYTLVICLATGLSLAVAAESNETNSAPTPIVGCGIRPKNKDLGFIVGGTTATAHSHPWAVAVYYNSRFICGATIINERYVLCAAHCILGPSASSYKLKVGAHKLASSGTFVEVKSVKKHQSYNAGQMQNDISLFELKSPLDFTKNKNIAPVCLPSKNIDKKGANDGKMATVVGWGTTKEGGTPSDTLMQVQVPILSTKDCKQMYSQMSSMITDKQVCAGYQNGGMDSCQGDSGGSICLPVGDKYYQLGVVSWGKGCAQPKSPGVYTRVSEQLDWINQNAKLSN